jgi:hypothetical protein
MVLGTAMQTYQTKLADEQEILTIAADIAIDVYAADSALQRARQAGLQPDATGGQVRLKPDATDGRGGLHAAAAQVIVHDAAARVEMAARTALAGMTEGDALRTLLAALRRVMKVTPVNTVALRRVVADAVVARKGYCY